MLNISIVILKFNIIIKEVMHILNYNQVEKGNRKLHVDNIFGEVVSMKIKTSWDYNTWKELLDKMLNLDNEQMFLQETEYPFDIIEENRNYHFCLIYIMPILMT